MSRPTLSNGIDSNSNVADLYEISRHCTKRAGDEKDKCEPSFDEARTARLLRKLDLNIVPFLALLYLLSFLDRTNIGNARLVGIEKDLKMKGLDYNIALAVFFPWFIAAEIPSNLMMKRTSPSLWICFIMVSWGICMTIMGLVKDFTSLLIVRMALGLAEGGLSPGVTWYIMLWYRRHECGLRIAIFFSAATLAGAFGGFLARVISEMKGIGERPGWAWIFIIEGLATVVVAIVAKFVISDSPDSAKFLTEEERCEVKLRLMQDHAVLAEEYHIKYVFAAVKDGKIYIQMVILLGTATPIYSISLFLPTIIKNMGYTNNQSQLLTIPPYILGCVVTICGGFLADKYKKRGPYMMFFCVVAIAGFVILISTRNPPLQYFGTFLAVSGAYPTLPMVLAWNGNNIGGTTKRAVGIAMQVAFGNIAGIIAAFTFQTRDAPHYFFGFGLLLAMVTMSLILSFCMHIYLKRENAGRDEAMKEKGLTFETYTEEMMSLEREKGDGAAFFRYTI